MIPPRPSDGSPKGASQRWRTLHRDILACTRCVESGHISSAAPIFQGRPGQRLMLIGQAPGVAELGPRKPFAGRAGRELERWVKRAGFAGEDHFRSLTYVTSVTKCFPGKAITGSGDRRPSGAEVAQCRPWLLGQMELQRPRLIILMGSLAIEQFTSHLPGGSLDVLVGRIFETDAGGPLLLPLPHPSGASRWLNAPGHRTLLEQALSLLGRTWPDLVQPGSGYTAS
jgi:uracil-DNA glycosylase family 4